MGFGYYGNGGSSSSLSNLSAFASPFTVGRTVSNPNSNPLVNFMNEPTPPSPPYGGATYNSSLHSWVPSLPASMPDYNANFDSEVDSMPLPSLDNYLVPRSPLNAGAVDATGALYGQYTDSVPTTAVDEVYPYYTYNSSLHSWVPSLPASMPDYNANFDSEVDSMPLPSLDNYLVPLSPLNAGAVDATGALYGQYTDSVPTTAVDEVYPYHPSYVSPAIKEKARPVGDSTYDFLSVCCPAPTDVTSQDDYTKNLSGWGSSTRWDGSWNGLGDLESGKCTDYDWSFYLNTANVAGTPISQDYVVKPGSELFKGFSTSAKTCDVSHSINVLGRENRTGPFSANQSDGKSFLTQDFEFIQSESSTSGASKLGTVSTSVSPGTHRQATSLESITNSPSSQNPYNAKYDICLRQYNTCLDNFTSVTKSAPALVVRPPAGGACSSQLNLKSYKGWNYNGTDVAGQNEDFSRKMLSAVNNPHLTLSSEGNEVCDNPSRLSIYFERNGQDVADTPSREALSSNKSITKDAFNHLSEATEPYVPQTIRPDRFHLFLDEAKASDSVESSDTYNPAEDSPHRKGATSSRFSTFEVSEAVAPQHLVERSDSCGESSLHGPQILPSLSNDAVRDISHKLSENFRYNQKWSMENGLSPSRNRPSITTDSNGEHGLNSSKAASFIPEQSCDVLHFSSTVEASTKESALQNNKKIDPDHSLSNTTEPLLQEVSFTSEKCASGTCFVETEMNPNDASDNGQSHFAIHTIEDCLSSLCGENAVSKLTKLHGEESTPKIDVPLLVKTMHNLSDLLLFYCSNDASALKEQDHAALKHVINSTNACILKSPQLPLKRNSLYSPQVTTHFLGESPDLIQGASVDRVHVAEIVAANAMNELDNQQIQEENRHNIVPGRKDEKFRDLVPVHNDADMVKTDEMSQAIKKVFIENFHDEEETLPQVLLHKNLWLEAKAVICSTNFRDCFDGMKNEMEKCRPHEAKDVSENMMYVENLSNSKVYPDVITVNRSSSDTRSAIQDSPIISTTNHTADVIHVEGSPISPDTKDGLKDGTFNTTMGHDLPSDECTEKLTAVNETGLCVNDVAIQSCDTDKLGNQHSPGWYDGSLLDWEHVLKDVIPASETYVEGSPISPDTKDGTFNMSMGHDLQQHPIDDCTEKQMAVNKTGICRNDAAIQSCDTDKLENQHSPGWYDDSSLDWEHVLKDDFV